MARVNVRQEVAAPASAVWALIGDLEHAIYWPAVASCEVERSGAGCVRTLRLVDGAIVRERVEAHDDDTRSYASEVLLLGHMPIKDYRYSVCISALGPERCVVDWLATFEPVGISEERARHMIEGLFTTAMCTLRETVEG